MSAIEEKPVVESERGTVGDYARNWWVRVRAGELGALPILIGLAVIVAVFGTLEDVFLTSRNFTNLLLQMADKATLAMGIIFVLLIAEIDLSVAFNSAVGAVVMTLLLRPGDPGWPWWLAVLVALAVTTLTGMIIGLIVTKAGVPSFVVTLAFLLGLSGVVLILTTQFTTSGTITIQDDVVIGVANSFLPPLWGWFVAGSVVVGFTTLELVRVLSRRRSGLQITPIGIIGLKVAGLAVVTGAGVWFANQDRGVPVVSLILLVFVVFWSFVAGRTRFGRHVYAVGGNPEAARRAGIGVDRVRIVVFMIAGLMAGVGGVILGSRLRSVAPSTGGGNLLLNVIAAAVIGGTSLFGGHGRVINALLGALVIAAVENGMDLLGLNSGTKFVITGAVLLAAVLVDSLSRRKRAAAGVA